VKRIAALCFSLAFALPAWAGRAVVDWEHNYVNVRSGPGTEYESVGRLALGTEADLLEEKGEWVHVRHPGGEGWVIGRSLIRLPEVATPAAATVPGEAASTRKEDSAPAPAVEPRVAEPPAVGPPAVEPEGGAGGYLAEYTADADLPPAPGASLLRLVSGLFLVLALIAAAVWAGRRFMGPRFSAGRRAGGIRVLATRSLGARHGLFLVETGGLVWLLGQGPDSVRLIAEIRDPETLRRLDDRYEFLEAPFESELRRELDVSDQEPAAQRRGAEGADGPSPEERLAALRRRPKPGGMG
jgi:flagellar biosynthetic protein FliO